MRKPENQRSRQRWLYRHYRRRRAIVLARKYAAIYEQMEREGFIE